MLHSERHHLLSTREMNSISKARVSLNGTTSNSGNFRLHIEYKNSGSLTHLDAGFELQQQTCFLHHLMVSQHLSYRIRMKSIITCIRTSTYSTTISTSSLMRIALRKRVTIRSLVDSTRKIVGERSPGSTSRLRRPALLVTVWVTCLVISRV